MTETDFIAVAAGSVEGTTVDEDGTVRALTDEQWLARVEQRALDLAVLSHQSQALTVVQSALSGVDKKRFKTFVSTIVDVEREESSTRGLIHLQSMPSENNETGEEVVRTGRTDSSQSARDLANKAVSLIDHRVRLFIELEPMGTSGKSVRVVHHIVDLGATG